MTDLRKAAEMALDALHNIDQSNNYDAIEALRQALAQPEQEPVAWRYQTITFWDRVPQTRYLESLEGVEGLLGLEPLYTAPPKRQWVGLTRRELDIATLGLEDLSDCYKAIEAKLKEKNGG